MKQQKTLGVIACGLLLMASNATAQSNGDRPAWSVTPYLWAADTTIDLAFRDNIGVGGELSFGDVVDTLDAGFMLHVENHGSGNWSTFGDLFYLRTSDTTERPALSIDAENEQILLDVVAAYWPAGVGTPLNVFGGMRYSGFDNRYRFRALGNPLADRRSSSNYYDALLGIRYEFDLSERWALLTRGDASFGDSEGTYLLRANFAYTVGKRQQNRIVFGYQHKEAEYKDGDLVTDFTLSGPMAGFNFVF